MRTSDGVEIEGRQGEDCRPPLAVSESRPQALIATNGGITWATSPEGMQIGEALAWQAFTGQTAAETNGHGWADVIHPEDRERTLSQWQDALRTGNTFNVEHRIRRYDGVYREMEVRAAPVRDAAGAILVWTGASIDITDRKSAERTALLAHRKLETVLQSITDGFIVLDPQWRFTYFNEQGARMIGMTQEELIGQCVWELFPHARTSKFYESYQHAVESGEPVHFTEYYPEPLNMWLECHCYPSEEGLSVFFRDITDRKRAESALRESEEQLTLLIDHAPVALAMFDLEMRYVRVSNRWVKDQHLDAGKLIGRSHYADSADVLEKWGEVHRRGLNGEMLKGDEHFEDRKERAWVHWEVHPWYGKTGSIGGIVIFSEDITARKEWEQAEQSKKDLLGALAANVQKAREDERTAVARDLHDQIGQLLTAIKMDVTWVARHLPQDEGELQNRLKRTIELVNDGARSVRAICTGLRPGVLDDLGLAAAIEWQAHEFFSNTGIHCQVSVPSVDSPLNRDQATAVFRIFQESLTNVMRHADAKSVNVSLEYEQSAVMLIVQDDGKGFRAPELLGALGILGMKERAKANGGELQVDGSGGSGTKVILRMRCNALDEQEAPCGF